MPEHWHARVASIAAYDDDASAQGRFESWRYALEVARDSPVVGGGFEIFRGNKVATASGYRARTASISKSWPSTATSGWPFSSLSVIGAYVSAGSVVRRSRDHADLAWAADLAAMVQVSIAAYAIAGLFLNLATFDLYYHLIAIVVITQSLVRQGLMADVAPTPPQACRPSSGHPMPAREGVAPSSAPPQGLSAP